MFSKLNSIFLLTLLVVFILNMTLLYIDEREHGVKFRFGEIVKSDYEPGLHFKIPIVNEIRKYPNRILNYGESQERFLTGEKKNLLVDYFITWRITDPGQYYRAARVDELFAQQRLSAIIREGIKAEFSRRTVQEVVSAFEAATGERIDLENVARRPGDVTEAWADPSFAKDFLGWESKRGLEEALADAWRWQTKNPQGYGKVEGIE